MDECVRASPSWKRRGLTKEVSPAAGSARRIARFGTAEAVFRVSVAIDLVRTSLRPSRVPSNPLPARVSDSKPSSQPREALPPTLHSTSASLAPLAPPALLTMSLSDSDVDFDDPRFLVDTPSTSSAPLSYQDRRKRKLIESEEKGRAKSRKQLEEEKREVGLRTDLIQRAKEDEERGGESKAFRMMRSVCLRWLSWDLTDSLVCSQQDGLQAGRGAGQEERLWHLDSRRSCVRRRRHRLDGLAGRAGLHKGCFHACRS